MPKIKLTFRRQKTVYETGAVEVEVTPEDLATLRQGKNMEAWAIFTMQGQVPEWRQNAALNPRVSYEAEVTE